MNRAYVFYVPGWGAFWQRGANAVRVRRHLTAVGIPCPWRVKEKAARAGTRTTKVEKWKNTITDIIRESEV